MKYLIKRLGRGTRETVSLGNKSGHDVSSRLVMERMQISITFALEYTYNIYTYIVIHIMQKKNNTHTGTSLYLLYVNIHAHIHVQKSAVLKKSQLASEHGPSSALVPSWSPLYGRIFRLDLSHRN